MKQQYRYEESKEPSSFLGGPALPALGHALAGSAGAAISNVCTYPLDLIITRLQVQRQLRKDSLKPDSDEYKSIQDAFYRIRNNEGGLGALYAGVLQDTSKTIADSFLFFLAYTFIRQSRLRARGSEHYLPIFDELGVGFVAGALSKFLTTPIANIVTRMQTLTMMAARDSSSSSDKGSADHATVKSIANAIYSEKGIEGFWSGYSASLVLTLNPSLTFFFFETFKRLAIPKSLRSNPPAAATFLFAAISKAMASTITYPFSLAKARAQVSSRQPKPNVSAENDETKGGSQIVASSKGLGRGTTVFSAIVEIARKDGIQALYEGLGGEVMKGFLSHGLMMITKEMVHKFIIRLYYTVLRLRNKYPSPQELASKAQEQAQETVQTIELARSTLQSNISSAAAKATEAMEEFYKNGGEKSNEFLKDAHEIADLIADYVGEEVEALGPAIINGKGSGGTEGE